ncbi:hypothetical protein V8G54_035594 [Vigna mungo]|uniref:Uncharacterized protein n=1 Tax=Vigna mungo TaxID=3915 RepID=A0AAQ3MFQ8_VIGMU
MVIICRSRSILVFIHSVVCFCFLWWFFRRFLCLLFRDFMWNSWYCYGDSFTIKLSLNLVHVTIIWNLIRCIETNPYIVSKRSFTMNSNPCKTVFNLSTHMLTCKSIRKMNAQDD